MTHALAAFIRQQMDERGLRNRDVVAASGLSRALVSKYVTDKRETLSRLPEKETVAGLAKAFNVSADFLLGKAIEALGLGYESGDFVNGVATATDRQLLEELEQRLAQAGVHGDLRGLRNQLVHAPGQELAEFAARLIQERPDVAEAWLEAGDAPRPDLVFKALDGSTILIEVKDEPKTDNLPRLTEGRQERRRRLQQAALPQTQAAYDPDDEESG